MEKNTLYQNENQINQYRSQYGDVIRNLNAAWNEFRILFQTDDPTDFFKVLFGRNIREVGLRDELTLLFAEKFKPAGMVASAVVRAGLIAIPDFGPLITGISGAKTLLQKIDQKIGYANDIFYYPPSKLFDEETNEFTLTVDFHNELKEAFTLNASKPDNVKLIDELEIILNKISKAGGFPSGISKERMFEEIGDSFDFDSGSGKFSIKKREKPGMLIKNLSGAQFGKKKYNRTAFFNVIH